MAPCGGMGDNSGFPGWRVGRGGELGGMLGTFHFFLFGVRGRDKE